MALFSKVKGLLRSLAVRPESTTPALWIDRADAPERIARLSDPFLREHAERLCREGVTSIPRNVTPDLCDSVFEAFESYCDRNVESQKYRDEYGRHSRLTNFHLESEVALEIGLNARVLRLLDVLLGARSAVFASLVFDRGSQQAIHRDSPFFHTRPTGLFFGVWTALERIDDDAGPLIYYPGGHRVAVDHLSIGQRHLGVPFSAAFDDYVGQVQRACIDAGLELATPRMEKGDTLIWHPDLPHGGSAIVDRTMTRRSIVFHYVPEGTPILGFDCFFSGKAGSSARPPRYRRARGRYLVDHGGPKFDHNY